MENSVYLSWAPFYCAFTCLIILLLSRMHRDSVPACLRTALILFYNAISFNWLYINQIVFSSSFILILLPLFYASGISVPIFFYQFIFYITRINEDEKMSWKHYLLPAVLFAFTLIWLLASPPGEKEEFLLSFLENKAGSKKIISFEYIAQLRALINLIYCFISIRRIHRYRKQIVNYTSNQERSSLNWIYTLIVVLCCQVTLPIITAALGIGRYKGQLFSPTLIILVLLVFWQNVSLVYNLLTGNFVLLPGKDNPVETSLADNSSRKKLCRKLEKYMQENKPYLQPDLRITDLIQPLQTNRTTLSAVINEEYHMNFCRFINSYRLAEFKRLRADPQYNDIKNSELIIRSGFSNYKTYQRTKQSAKE